LYRKEKKRKAGKTFLAGDGERAVHKRGEGEGKRRYCNRVVEGQNREGSRSSTIGKNWKKKGGNNERESTTSSMGLSKRKQGIWGRGSSEAKRAQREGGGGREESHKDTRESASL